MIGQIRKFMTIFCVLGYTMSLGIIGDINIDKNVKDRSQTRNQKWKRDP